MCSFCQVNVCLILHGLLIWQIDVFLTPFLCRGDVCGPAETQRGYTHDWLHNSTPRVESHPRGQKGSWVCTHSPIHPSPSFLSFFISRFLSNAAITVCFLHYKEMSWGGERRKEEEDTGGGHRRRWQFSRSAVAHTGQDGSVCMTNGKIRSLSVCLC